MDKFAIKLKIWPKILLFRQTTKYFGRNLSLPKIDFARFRPVVLFRLDIVDGILGGGAPALEKCCQQIDG